MLHTNTVQYLKSKSENIMAKNQDYIDKEAGAIGGVSGRFNLESIQVFTDMEEEDMGEEMEMFTHLVENIIKGENQGILEQAMSKVRQNVTS